MARYHQIYILIVIYKKNIFSNYNLKFLASFERYSAGYIIAIRQFDFLLIETLLKPFFNFFTIILGNNFGNAVIIKEGIQ